MRWICRPLLVAGLVSAFVTAGSARASYVVTSVPYTFQDISGTGTRTLAGTDDSTASVSPVSAFPFYGTNYGTIFYSTNGLISFGAPNGSFSNSDLSSSGNTGGLPTIAVLWDDLQAFQGGADAVYAQAFADRTVIQWNDIGGFASSPSLATFQAVLYANGDILLSYKDVAFGDSRSGGASATVGVRNSDGQFTQFSVNSVSLVNETSLLLTADVVTAVSAPAPAGLILAGLGIPVAGLLRFRRRTA